MLLVVSREIFKILEQKCIHHGESEFFLLCYFDLFSFNLTELAFYR